jgi:hypothetical protein
MSTRTPWAPIGSTPFTLPEPASATTAQLRFTGLLWLLATLAWARLTLYPLLLSLAPAQELGPGSPSPSLAQRISLGTAFSLLLVWALWLLLSLRTAALEGRPKFV